MEPLRVVKGTIKATPGSVNIPIVCASAYGDMGDVVVADDDGVVCVPRGIAAQTLEGRPQARGQRRRQARHLRRAALNLDYYKMREPLEGRPAVHPTDRPAPPGSAMRFLYTPSAYLLAAAASAAT